jgi:catalase
VAGRHGLTEEQLKTESDNFLIPELHHRVDRGTVEFEAWLQIAEPGDQTTDPTLQWPADRQQLLVGRLKLNKFDDQACDKAMFNPLALPKGITASDDSTLAVRPAAYATSLTRRLTK